MDERPSIERTFIEAATWFSTTLNMIPDSAWSRPGLGEWNLRALVGHTARALVTVNRALAHPATDVLIATAADYLLQTASIQSPGARSSEGTTVTERGIAAGKDLGPRPAIAVQDLVETTMTALETLRMSTAVTEQNPIVTTIGGGMRLSEYLRTRVFELVVHGLDVQNAIVRSRCVPEYVPAPPPPSSLDSALTLAQQVASARGFGAPVLLALTGREPLPNGFSLLDPPTTAAQP